MTESLEKERVIILTYILSLLPNTACLRKVAVFDLMSTAENSATFLEIPEILAAS